MALRPNSALCRISLGFFEPKTQTPRSGQRNVAFAFVEGAKSGGIFLGSEKSPKNVVLLSDFRHPLIS